MLYVITLDHAALLILGNISVVTFLPQKCNYLGSLLIVISDSQKKLVKLLWILYLKSHYEMSLLWDYSHFFQKLKGKIQLI